MPMSALPERGPKFYRALFVSTFMISAFTVGGGFVIIPLLKAKYVDEYGWLDDRETLNLIAIAQSMPGVVAANRMAGLAGALTALVATVLPPLITLSLISRAYDAFAHNPYVALLLKGMQCGATALIISVAFDLLEKQLKTKLALPLLVIVGTFCAQFFFDVPLMLLIVVDGLIGLLFMRDAKYN